MEAAQQESGPVGMALGNLSGANTPMRQKTWDECTPEQRMEMMREEVRYLRRSVTGLEGSIRKLKAHQHAQDGSLMVPMKNRDDDDRPRGYFYDPLK